MYNNIRAYVHHQVPCRLVWHCPCAPHWHDSPTRTPVRCIRTVTSQHTPSIMGTISMYIEPDILNGTAHLSEIVETLEALVPVGSETRSCIVCDDAMAAKEHAPCCGADCARQASTISLKLATSLPIQDTDADADHIVRNRGEEAKHAANVMLAIITHGLNVAIHSRIRCFLLRLSKDSGRIPSSLILKGGTFKLGAQSDRKDGGFAYVYRSIYNDMPVAAKTIHGIHLEDCFPRRKSDDPDETTKIHERTLTFCYEALVWRTLNHERLNPLLGIFQSVDPGDYMISQWHPDGDALNFLKAKMKTDERYQWGGEIHERLICRWLLQVTEGLEHLHGQLVTHGDLHAGNILVVNRRPAEPDYVDFDILLTDFGLSVLYEENSNQQFSLRAGTFRAPEQIASESYEGVSSSGRPTVASDIFSFAALCYQLYTTRKPFQDEYHPDPAGYRRNRAFVAYELPSRMLIVSIQKQLGHIPVEIPDQLWEIILMCWRRPEERPTLDVIIGDLKNMERSLS